MPIVNKTHQLWNARQVLYARCPACELILNWVHSVQDEFFMGAMCCDLAFNARLNPEGRLTSEFSVTAGQIEMAPNVYLFPG